MTRHRLAIIILAITVVALAREAAGPGADLYVSRHDYVLGTSMELKSMADSPAAAARAEESVLAEIDRLSGILSGYEASSEFSRWFGTRDIAVPVSAELFDVLRRFDEWRQRTDGALDASAETISRVWRTAEAAGRLPADTDLARAVRAVRRRHWQLDPVAHTATHLDAAPIVLNSFAKSFIVDRAAAAGLAVDGVHGLVVNIGGDLAIRGDWSDTVGVTDPKANADNAPPMARLMLHDRAVATSGGYRRGFDIGGVHYSHIVDPRTGRPAGAVLSATVVAPDAADAGALATTFCVVAPDDGAALAATVPGAEFMLVLADGSRIESAGWRGLTVPRVRPSFVASPIASLLAAEQALWKPEFELTIALEIAQQPMRANRPYVAVWVEDADRVPVRTLAVWYLPREGKFLPDLKSWYRSDRERSRTQGTEILESISSATRAPGKYTLIWDGKDNAGRPVRAGTYTVYIEAAREHGTYQLIHQAMDFSGVPQKAALPGNIEIASASLDYHRAGGR